MIWATLLVILSVAMTIWQIIEKSPAAIIFLFVVLSIMNVMALCQVVKEYLVERKQKK